MPSMQVVVECSSPIITYDSRWSSGSSNDNLANQYTASSFTLTQTQGAISTFLFNGTSVTVVGAKRGNHGRYQGQVDGVAASIVSQSGLSATPLFNQTLYSWSGAAGLHTLTFENLDNAFLDIDYIAFTTSIGQDNEALITDTYQESNPAFTFSPAASWTTPPFTGSFSGGSGMVTSDPNAAANFKFIGDGVALHGPVGAGYQVSYTVQIDNGPIALLQAPPFPPNGTTPREVIYMATSLGKGTHSLTIRLAQPPAAGQLLGIDFADVFTTPSIGSSLTSSASSPSGSGTATTGNTNTNGGSQQPSDPDVLKLKIALGITSAIAGLAIIYVIYSLFAARRRRAQQANDKLPFSHPTNVPSINTMVYARPQGAQRDAIPSTNMMSANLGSGAGLSYTSESNNFSPISGSMGHTRGQESFSAGSTSAYGGMASTISDELPRPRTDGKRQLVAHNGSSTQVQAPPAYSANGR